jgi:hypothetical protein
VTSVSVVIPTRNRLGFLEEAVKSVLAQSSDLELIVVDDASSDGTEAWLADQRDSRIRSIRLDQRSERSRARNAGLRAVHAPWVFFLDDDDLVAPMGLPRLLSAARSFPRAVAIAGRVRWFREGSATVEAWIRATWIGNALADCVVKPILQPSRALLARSTLERIGGWSEEYNVCEDLHLSLTVASLGAVVVVPDVVGEKRIHSDQTDLTGWREARAAVLEDVAGALSVRDRGVMRRRIRALELLAMAKTTGPSHARARSQIVRGLLADPSILRTPLGRLYAMPVLGRAFIPKDGHSLARRAWQRFRGRAAEEDVEPRSDPR